jgi:hypothetical protein
MRMAILLSISAAWETSGLNNAFKAAP